MSTALSYLYFRFISFDCDFYRTRVRSLGMLDSDSLTDSLTHSRLVNLIDVTLARVDDNSKCVKAVLLLLWMIRIVSTTVWSRQGQ